MLLGELLDRRDFGLHLLVDPDGGAAQRPLHRVFSTDQPLPQRYMSGGELVLTGLIFHGGSPAESEAFVASAAAGGAVAIGAGVDRFGHIPDHFLDACRSWSIPMFSVPADVSFADLTQTLIDHAGAATARVRAHLTRSREMLAAVAAGTALDNIAATVVAATGIRCWVLTAAGKRVVAVGPSLAEDQLDRILAAAATAPALPASADAITILPVGTRADRAGAWYLVLGSAPAGISPEAMDAFGEFAAIAALVRAREADAAVVRNAADDAAVAQLAAGGFDGLAGAIVVARYADPARLRPLVRDALVTIPHVSVSIADGAVVAILPGEPQVDAVAEELRRQLTRVADALDGPVQVGVSDPVQAGGLGGALRGARQAAAAGDGAVSVVRTSALGSASALLAMLPDEVRAGFVHRVLGPLLDYDGHTSADLVPTLRVFLANGGSWVRTADALHLHPNTVRYRIGRVQELTGRSLDNIGDRVDIHLALTLH